MTGPSGAYERVRDHVGSSIADGTLAEGTVVTVEHLERLTGTSRSIVREATRVLVSKGLLSATQRVGFRVLPESRWNMFDPDVIRWRLNSGHHTRQRLDLFELRSAIEPEAARLAALRRSLAEAASITAAAERVSATGEEGAASDFLAADLEFHCLVLRASQNATFLHLGGVIDETLRQRATIDRATLLPDRHDLWLHTEVARLIAQGDAESAAERMREIVARTAAVAPAPDDASV